ncbi:MAG TPA: hypothetical protein VGG28_33000 [Kofleriaceae bacterium]|jgi:hypothetical protein
MRTLVIALVIAATSATASADVGLGLFVGEPVGLDLKIDAGYRSSLDIVLGWSTFRDARDQYAHLTYLATPVIGHGDAITVPLRIGIGVAFYGEGGFDNGVNIAVRAPIEIALRFRRAPVEIYGEIAAEITFFDDNNDDNVFDLQGGIGFRIYF